MYILSDYAIEVDSDSTEGQHDPPPTKLLKYVLFLLFLIFSSITDGVKNMS